MTKSIVIPLKTKTTVIISYSILSPEHINISRKDKDLKAGLKLGCNLLGYVGLGKGGEPSRQVRNE